MIEKEITLVKNMVLYTVVHEDNKLKIKEGYLCEIVVDNGIPVMRICFDSVINTYPLSALDKVIFTSKEDCVKDVKNND